MIGTGPRGNWGLGYVLGIPWRTRKSRQSMQKMCDQRLVWLVNHAWRTIPYYRRLMEEAGVAPDSITGFRDLERLPVIRRTDLREAGEAAWADDLPEDRRIMASTSGSSDTPLRLAYRFGDRLRKHAISLHCMSLYGWRPWHRGMALGSEALPVRHPLTALGISRWDWVDPSLPVKEWLDRYHEVRPHALHSYPSALREFCFEAQSRGPLKWQPRVLSVGGELCPPELSPLATQVFGRPPLVMYGAVEGGRLAFESAAHCGLHVRVDSVHIELLRNGRAVGPGETGSVVMTSLINTVMPLIRYELGDLASWEDGPCDSDLWWPRISLYQGRRGDVIPMPGGRRVPVTRLASIVGKSPLVRQFQFIRRKEGQVVLRYEPQHGPNTDIEGIRQELLAVLPGVDIELEISGQLPRTRSGKVTRFIDEWGQLAAEGAN